MSTLIVFDRPSVRLLKRLFEFTYPTVMADALRWFGTQVGSDQLDKLLLTFVEQFPGASIIAGQHTAQQWLASTHQTLFRRLVVPEVWALHDVPL